MTCIIEYFQQYDVIVCRIEGNLAHIENCNILIDKTWNKHFTYMINGYHNMSNVFKL